MLTVLRWPEVKCGLRTGKVIWEELRRHLSRRRTTTPHSPHWLQCDASHLPQNCPSPSTISTHI